MREYPADRAEAAFRFLRRWLGARYARAVRVQSFEAAEGVGRGSLEVARRWPVQVTVLDTLAADAEPAWETARAALEEQLDRAGLNLAVFVPRNAPLPVGEPDTSGFVAAALAASALPDGRLEVRRPVTLHLRRVAPDGSVITAVGGLAPHWARFSGQIEGTFHLDSRALFRISTEAEAREALFERVVTAASEALAGPEVSFEADDAWSALDLEEGGSIILGTPKAEGDEWSAALRRNIRRLLQQAASEPGPGETTARVLALLGAATYAEEERLSWVLKGVDPAAYAGYDIVAVIADGLVKPILEPPAGGLPWDA